MSGGEIAAAIKPVLTAAAKPAGGWLRRKLRPDTSAAALNAATEQLALDVARIERVRLDQLQVSYRMGMPVRFGDLSRVELANNHEGILGSLPSIEPFYRSLAGPQRLLVVGEPGSGKTVLALHLILDLLSTRMATGEPVPVRCNATGWDGCQNLSDFLADKLSTDYAIHQRLARALIDHGRILPVLDGLDEMDVAEHEPRRAMAAMDRLNEPPWRGRSLVITCRAAVYDRIREARDGTGMYECKILSVRPLTPTEIAERVQTLLDEDDRVSQRYARRLAPLLEELDANPNGVLAPALRTPWMLTLALSYLENADADAVDRLTRAASEQAVTDMLFAAQIPIACQQQTGDPDTWTFAANDVQRWMRNLASHLSSRSESGGRTEVALHQLWLLTGKRRTRRLHAVAFGLLATLIVWPLAWLAEPPTVRPLIGAVGALAVGLAVGFAVALMSLIGIPSSPGRIVLKTRRKGALKARLTVGLAYGGFVGVVVWASTGAAFGFLIGLKAGAIAVPASGLVASLQAVPRRFRPPRDASKEIHDDLLAGLAFGLAFGLTIGLAVGLRAGLPFGLAAGVACVLLVGALFASTACTYGATVAISRWTGLFATRPARFLDWGTKTGLLRITGTAFQFRHETYRQWLTDHPASD